MMSILKNPLTVWLRWLLLKTFLELKNRKNKLTIGYLAFLKNCKLGYCNKIYEYSVLTKVSLGDFTYVNDRCRIDNTNIGKFCSIGQHVKCGLGIHPSGVFVSTHPAFYSTSNQCGTTFVKSDKFNESKVVEIGNDVWIGTCSIILDGVKIGDGAIIAAGSVVVSDVPPYAIFGGAPARLIKYRFDEKTIDKLILSRWWDRDVDWIKDRIDSFCNIDNFLKIVQ